jgi:multisubunit Na+/H+ antiporter MnhB subunit
MLRREKIVYSISLIVIVTLASVVVFLYVNIQDSQQSIELELIRRITQQANTVNGDIMDLVWRFHYAYEDIKQDDRDFELGNISNETKDALFWRTINDYFYPSPGNNIIMSFQIKVEDDIKGLFDLLGEPEYTTYSNITETIRYAIPYDLFYDPLMTSTIAHEILVRAYTILGIDQADQWRSVNYTALSGIGISFSALSRYWLNQTSITLGKSAPEFSVIFDWALANATQLYQNASAIWIFV